MDPVFLLPGFKVMHSSTALHCSSCSYSTDDAKLLVRHVRVKHREPVDGSGSGGGGGGVGTAASAVTADVNQCPVCPYQTPRRHLFQRHMKVHSAEESCGGPNLFACLQVIGVYRVFLLSFLSPCPLRRRHLSLTRCIFLEHWTHLSVVQ